MSKRRSWNDDPFTKKAQRENYAARSVYKLQEIDQRERILKGCSLVLDLGAAPGSWSQYVLEKLPPNGKLVAVDLVPISLSDPRLTVLTGDMTEMDLAPHIGDKKVDLVLSDMAPKTSGIHDRDVQLSFELASLALETSRKFLRPGGSFVAKLFMGESFKDYEQLLKETFGSVRMIRPQSTRKHSREIFFVAKTFLIL